MSEYVTYGLGNKFDSSKLLTDLSLHLGSKPKSAWWGSPVDAEFGWKDWCSSEHWLPAKAVSFDDYFSDSNAIKWKLIDGTKVLNFDTLEDIEFCLENKFIVKVIDYAYCFDFIRLLESGYSAVELKNLDFRYGSILPIALELLFSSWDCQSIVVLDPSKIIQTN